MRPRLRVALPVAVVVSLGFGLILRPALDSLLLRPDLSVHESRRSLLDWKYARLQVLASQWKLTGEFDRSGGRDDLIWLWRIVLLNASLFGDECVVRVTRFSLRDPQGFDVAAGEPAPQEITVRSGATASVSGSGRLARVRMSPKLRPNWELQTTCPKGLPQFGEAKITEILETVPRDRRLFVRDLSDDGDSRTLGSVAKVRALHWSVAKYIQDAREQEEDQRKAGVPRRLDTLLDEFFKTPLLIQIQFPRGATVKVGDVIYLFDQRFVEDEAGVRSVGYGFASDGASLPLRHWHDKTLPPPK